MNFVKNKWKYGGLLSSETKPSACLLGMSIMEGAYHITQAMRASTVEFNYLDLLGHSSVDKNRWGIRLLNVFPH